jgi:hypothetical protein
MKKPIGIIQSRGLGDILMTLPIARYYLDHLGYDEVVWPICEEFWSSVKETASWVHWIPIPTDTKGDFFWTEPNKRLKALNVSDIVCLYQSLNIRPELSKVPFFQLQKFDEFKYSKAGVPFLRKWTLAECITRNPEREKNLYDKLVKSEKYAVIHSEGSTFSFRPDTSSFPEDWQQIEITEQTDCIFDWLKIIEGAEAVVMIDSVFSNMVDQLKIEGDKYWLPRSHIHLTPVLGTEWTILEPPPGSTAAQKIFSVGA